MLCRGAREQLHKKFFLIAVPFMLALKRINHKEKRHNAIIQSFKIYHEPKLKGIQKYLNWEYEKRLMCSDCEGRGLPRGGVILPLDQSDRFIALSAIYLQLGCACQNAHCSWRTSKST